MNRLMKLSQHWCSDKSVFKDYKQRRVRCKTCSKMVMTRPVFCIGGELLGHEMPPHKTKPKAVRRPKGDRSGTRSRRG